MIRESKRSLVLCLIVLLVACLLPVSAFGEAVSDENWITFVLICNEGMQNTGGNVGNTMSVVAINQETGIIRLMMFTWDTFVQYDGYDAPQRIDTAYRNNGPQETMRVFNQNFDTDISLYLSLNYSNLASLVDAYGGVTIDVSRAERNALNSMVASKKDALQAQIDSGFVNQMIYDLVAQEYYLDDFGPETHLNGLQAVAYGWLQYDSVYNCCKRDAKVISDLFHSVAESISRQVIFYSDASGYPDNVNQRRAINMDAATDEDIAYLRTLVSPIFQMSDSNLSDEDVTAITLGLARNAYQAMRSGYDIFKTVEIEVFPLEALNQYDRVAGVYGHLIDYDANRAAMWEFLYGE